MSTSDQHLVQWLPSRGHLLGGGSPGRLLCSCGWEHPAIDARTAAKLAKLHHEGQLR